MTMKVGCWRRREMDLQWFRADSGVIVFLQKIMPLGLALLIASVGICRAGESPAPALVVLQRDDFVPGIYYSASSETGYLLALNISQTPGWLLIVVRGDEAHLKAEAYALSEMASSRTRFELTFESIERNGISNASRRNDSISVNATEVYLDHSARSGIMNQTFSADLVRAQEIDISESNLRFFFSWDAWHSAPYGQPIDRLRLKAAANRVCELTIGERNEALPACLAGVSGEVSKTAK